MGLGKPGGKGFRKRNSQRFQRQNEIRSRAQKLRNQYEAEIRHLNAEIRKSSQILMAMDEARRQGKTIDPIQHAEALRVRNTATTRLGHVTSRLQKL